MKKFVFLNQKKAFSATRQHTAAGWLAGAAGAPRGFLRSSWTKIVFKKSFQINFYLKTENELFAALTGSTVYRHPNTADRQLSTPPVLQKASLSTQTPNK